VGANPSSSRYITALASELSFSEFLESALFPSCYSEAIGS